MTTNLPSTQVNWDAEIRGATMLVKSGLVPDDIKKPEAAMFIILAGRDLGISPVQSLRSIRVIKGKVECSADLQLGLFHRDGGKTKWLRMDEQEAHLQLVAPWLSEPHVSKFTIEDAKRADLMSNATWRKYPKAMLRSRAITQGLKDIGFLAGSGVYAPGEISGGELTIDVVTGEVLPAEPQPAPVLKQQDHTPLGGVVEALPEAHRQELEQEAQSITDKIGEGKLDAALRTWNELTNDDKVAVWAMLDKDVRKAIKGARTEQVTSAAMASTTDAPTQLEHDPKASIEVTEVRKCIASLQFDMARDLLRSLPAVVQIPLRKEVDAAEKAANLASQP